MCPAAKRIWQIASLVWVAYIAWRSLVIWPSVPLDMGGVSPTRDAAYQAAQLQHVAKALGLALGVPAVAYLIARLLCRLAGKPRTDSAT